MSEMALLKEIQLALTRAGCRALRVNVGAGWTGQSKSMPDGTVIIRGARRFSTGLPKGFPDLMVICPQGKVVFMELKTESGQLSDDQKKMQEFLKGYGHHVCVCRSVEDAIKECTEE